MIEMLGLTAAAIAVRGSGGMVRGGEHAAPFRLAGWMLCAAGVWLLAGAGGAWFPLWPALAVGLFAGVVHHFIRRDQPIMALTDAALVLICGVLSIPMLGLNVLLGTVAFVVIIGFVLDQLPRIVPRKPRLAMFGAPVVLGIAGAIALDRAAEGGDSGAWYRSSFLAAMNIGITRPPAGERVELESGAVAWIDRPRRIEQTGRLPGAIVFHGNHPAGSHQPAACILRRALVQAGYVVLSLDQAGCGATPVSGDVASVEAWNPSPHVEAALRRLHSEPNVGSIIAIGHSMGCLDVLRLHAIDEAKPNASIVFGMGVFDPPQSDGRWVRGFVTVRNLPRDSIDLATGAAIRNRYYEMDRLLKKAQHPVAPLIFARFGREHENLVAGRARALRLLREPPTLWDLDQSTHYFSASERFGIIFGDVRITRDLARRRRHLHAPAAFVELDH